MKQIAHVIAGFCEYDDDRTRAILREHDPAHGEGPAVAWCLDLPYLLLAGASLKVEPPGPAFSLPELKILLADDQSDSFYRTLSRYLGAEAGY